MRFRRVLAEKMLGEVPESSGADTLSGSRRFRCRDLVRFRRVLAEKMLGEVQESSGADTL